MGIPSGPVRRLVEQSDFDAAVDSLRSVFGDVELRRSGSDDVGLTMRSVRTDDLAATRWAVRGVAGSSLDQRDQPDPVFLTGIRLGGRAEVWSGDGDIDASRPFVYPDVVHSRLAQPDVANLAVSVDAVNRAAAAMTDGLVRDVRFTGTAPADPALDAVWRGTAVYVSRTLESFVGGADLGIAQIGLVDHVAATLLHVFPNTALEVEQRQRESRAMHPTLRRALQFVDDHLGEPFTVPELAAAARVSLRGLHAVFRRELDTTPMAYVTEARLAAARAELERKDPSLTDVASVGVRWGFPSRSRFVGRYRQAFGEHPGETLRR